MIANEVFYFSLKTLLKSRDLKKIALFCMVFMRSTGETERDAVINHPIIRQAEQRWWLDGWRTLQESNAKLLFPIPIYAKQSTSERATEIELSHSPQRLGSRETASKRDEVISALLMGLS